MQIAQHMVDFYSHKRVTSTKSEDKIRYMRQGSVYRHQCYEPQPFMVFDKPVPNGVLGVCTEAPNGMPLLIVYDKDDNALCSSPVGWSVNSKN
jgi:hypothetical protein